MDCSKYLGENGLAEFWNLTKQYVDAKIWIGTKQEYQINALTIPIGTMIIITDENEVITPEDNNNSSIAILGVALLGSMVLGKS
jgi:hypothetical protein